MKNSISAEMKTRIKASRSAVWEALTNPDLIRRYFFGTNTHTTWEPGEPIRFDGEWQGKAYHDKGTVLQNKPQEFLEYNYWSSMSGIEDRPENYVIVSYALSGEDGDVTLTVCQENIPTMEMKEHSEQNWQKVMEGLKQLVESRQQSGASLQT